MGESHDELHEQYQNDQDELNNSDDFAQTYGFEHNCTCADDWAEGNLGVVSICYLEMVSQALDKLEEARIELDKAKADNAELRMEMAANERNPEDAEAESGD